MEHFIYGGDYNPDQWLDRPDILKEDVRLMKNAHMNEATLGVFAWAVEEPREGEYHLDWLEEIIDRLYENGISTILATPSGARPRWLAEKYPEVLRTLPDGTKAKFGGRHNHCFTSPVYRQKVYEIDRKLAEKFAGNPAVIGWHISNEFGGECYCPLCQEAFRQWLKKKYGTIEALNRAWWSTFWSHTYADFSEVEAPSPIGESATMGLDLDWKRFVTDQTADFMKVEKKALQDGGAAQPMTINMMYDYDGLDYGRMAKDLDIISWDSYPEWGGPEGNEKPALGHGRCHDYMRSLKDQPFLLMESCPSSTNWQEVSRLKAPGLLTCASLHAIGHGADSVQYFQIRQSRGSSEKFHGALIDQTGRDDTRVYKEAAEVGRMLERISRAKGAVTRARAALVQDTQNRWAIADTQGPRNCGMGYLEFIQELYRALKKQGIDVDVIDQDHGYDSYDLIVLPMLYSVRNENDRRLKAFVENGGVLVGTYFNGVVDETDLCFEGDTPHGLTDVFGIRRLEIDGLYDGQKNTLTGNGKTYSCDRLCERIALEGAETLLTYGEDFYAGESALTVHAFGKGKAYYLAAHADEALLSDLMRRAIFDAGIEPLVQDLPSGVEVQSRLKGDSTYLFFENFGTEEGKISLSKNESVLYGEQDGSIPPCHVLVVERKN